MARFDVYARPGASADGYVIDLQADLLDELSTRVVAPLLPPAIAPKPARDLNPTFEIEGKPYVLLIQFIAAVPARELRVPVASLAPSGGDITRALDILLVGF
jgi:toxin CcdB